MGLEEEGAWASGLKAEPPRARVGQGVDLAAHSCNEIGERTKASTKSVLGCKRRVTESGFSAPPGKKEDDYSLIHPHPGSWICRIPMFTGGHSSLFYQVGCLVMELMREMLNKSKT